MPYDKFQTSEALGGFIDGHDGNGDLRVSVDTPEDSPHCGKKFTVYPLTTMEDYGLSQGTRVTFHLRRMGMAGVNYAIVPMPIEEVTLPEKAAL